LQEREQQQEVRQAEQDDAYRPIQRMTQPQRTTTTNRPENRATTTTQRTTFPRAPRLVYGETISLNSSDTTQWMKIPGIGTTFANRIVRYQTRLGGFASIYQLLEVNGISDELFARIAPYILHNDSTLQKLHINQLEFRELLRHPYLEFEQVQVIMNLRRRTGSISSINELAMLSEFSENDIERLRPYLEF
jgi:DNA uptake protein ComE-like DNA-binding protein